MFRAVDDEAHTVAKLNPHLALGGAFDEDLDEVYIGDTPRGGDGWRGHPLKMRHFTWILPDQAGGRIYPAYNYTIKFI